MKQKGVSDCEWMGTFIVNKEAMKKKWDNIPVHMRWEAQEQQIGLYVDVWKIVIELNSTFYIMIPGALVKEAEEDIMNSLATARKNPLIKLTTCLIFPWGKVVHVDENPLEASDAASYIKNADAVKFADYVCNYSFGIQDQEQQEDWSSLFDDEMPRRPKRHKKYYHKYVNGAEVYGSEADARDAELASKFFQYLTVVNVKYMVVDLGREGEAKKSIFNEGTKEETCFIEQGGFYEV